MPAIWAHVVCRTNSSFVTSCTNLVTTACMNTRTMHCMCVLQEAPSYLRLPHPHADQERSQGAQGPPRQGPPQPVPCQREVLRRQEEVNAQHDTARQRHQQLTGLWPTGCCACMGPMTLQQCSLARARRCWSGHSSPRAFASLHTPTQPSGTLPAPHFEQRGRRKCAWLIPLIRTRRHAYTISLLVFVILRVAVVSTN